MNPNPNAFRPGRRRLRGLSRHICQYTVYILFKERKLRYCEIPGSGACPRRGSKVTVP